MTDIVERLRGGYKFGDSDTVLEAADRIAELGRELAGHRKSLGAAKQIIAGQENRIMRMAEHNLKCVEAVTSLQSARDANARLTDELAAAQAREKVLLEALNYCADNVPEFWTVPGVKAALNQPTDDTVLKAAIQHGIAEFLEHTGRYVTNDASRKAALKAERERCAVAFEVEVESWDEMRRAGYLGAIKRKGASAIRALEELK